MFGEFLQRLSQRNRLLRYDGRGCGLSDRGVPMASLDDEVRDLEAVLDAAGLETASRCSADRRAVPSRSAMRRGTPTA